MIFLSVGTQLPFPRLINLTLDSMREAGLTQQILCQTADEGFSPRSPAPEGCDFRPFIAADEFASNLIEADLVISHAGMGNILSCLEYQKTGIFFARSYELGEHRNDHQHDTVRSFQGKFPNIHLFTDESAFTRCLTALLQQSPSTAAGATPQDAPPISKEMAYFRKNIQELMEAL